ncbi:MAG: hrpB [Firmicutes bacterium]|nr:hrpB [Bacillota bacterium]
MDQLPIFSVLEQVKKILREKSSLILVAQPGAGKTTQVPLALFCEPWLKGQRILVLQPRKIAARMVAAYMARLLGENVGQTVGYRVRQESRVSVRTRIEVITEGILTRMLQEDASLASVGLIIFDEFHERNLAADTAMAFALEYQEVLRPDLRIVVMSATLKAETVAPLMGGADILRCPGRIYPVETHYLPQKYNGNWDMLVVEITLRATKNTSGNVLVFLPGEGEIRRIKTQLEAAFENTLVVVHALFGSMPAVKQQSAIAAGGPQKVILATSIAETSVTVEGITTVVDGGLARVSKLSARTGMTRLETVRVTKAEAEQRRGRAGRLGPGICYRLWTEEENQYLRPERTPEILEADLTSFVLDIALWGAQDATSLRLLNYPPETAYNQALQLLFQLGAVNEKGVITRHGRDMARAGVHPRLAHMIISAKGMGLGKLACELAAILEERDILEGGCGNKEADIQLRMEALRQNETLGEKLINSNVKRRVTAEVTHLMRLFGVDDKQENDMDACGVVLALGFFDRIAQRREDGRYLLRSGRGAKLWGANPLLTQAAYLIITDLDDQGTDSRIYLAAGITESELMLHFREQIAEERWVVWDNGLEAVRARKCSKIGAIVVKESPLDPSQEELINALLSGIAQTGLMLLPWTPTAAQLRDRILFMREVEQGWPDVTDESLLQSLDQWLAPFVYGMRTRQDLARVPLAEALEGILTWEQRCELKEQAPTHILVPSGQRVPIDYSQTGGPVLAVRLQEMFGHRSTPCVAKGRVPLTLHLLSPASRPVQITRDLDNFWRTTYFEVRKELMGRYPKHYWPEQPQTAIPTHRTKPRSSK